MNIRKKKILLVQLILLFVGLALIFLTYIKYEKENTYEIISKEDKIKINKQLIKDKDSKDTFYNIEYAGIDLSGNRYILKAKEAKNNENNAEIVNLKYVNASFYFKDNTTLLITSDNGTYNNKTLDMIFENNVKGNHTSSKLYAQKAEYSNSKGFLIVSNNVKIKDTRGTMIAEELIFDINENKLNINSSQKNKINANLNY